MAKKSKYQVNIPNNSKVNIEWVDNPVNYSNEKKKHIVSIVSDRYSVPKESVKVNFIPIKVNEKGETIDVSTDVINNIQDPKFQLKLFKDYILENNVENINFDFIEKIDSEINSKIDYDIYDKFRKYTIKWVELDNFLSYGSGVRFEFDTLKGLILVTSTPANQGGKTNFVIDVPSFLLFGKTQKPYTLSECFNKYLDVNTFRVCGCLEIDGLDYIIERIVTRTKKRNGSWGDASQKVKYYQIINGEQEELEDITVNLQDEHSLKTNKVIKEAVGSEKDFNMIVSATGDDLGSLIGTGNTERGRLLSKWIGLYPLEEKDKHAKEKFKEYEKTLKSKIYNKTDLSNEISQLNQDNTSKEETISNLNKRLLELEDNKRIEEQQKETLLSSKKTIDGNILKLDINTLEKRLTNITTEAEEKKKQLKITEDEYKDISTVTFSDEEYKNHIKLDKEYSISINDIKNKINNLKTTNKNLQESEFCPTCKRKYDGLDNSASIKANESEISELIKKGTILNEKLTKNKEKITKLDSDKIKYDRKIKLEGLINIIPIQIDNLRQEYKDKRQSIKDFNDNKDAIKKNNDIDISLINVNAKLNAISTEKDIKIKEIERYKRDILDNTKKIETNNIIISEIDIELENVKNWNVYLEMVGKNGISKMVLKKTLPIINSELSRLLEDVCDFDVDVVLTDKNEVNFKIIKDDVSSDLGGGSGFEKTAASLALRTVLANISTMSRPNFITLDEILGKVAKDNYESMKILYDKILPTYQFILHISHLDEIKEWHDGEIVISKNNNISDVKLVK